MSLKLIETVSTMEDINQLDICSTWHIIMYMAVQSAYYTYSIDIHTVPHTV